MSVFLERRARLLSHLREGSVALLATAPEVARNSDCDYPYRHDSYFYYLTGFTEPDSVLVLVAPRAHVPGQSILFCRPKNVEREIWDGFRHGPDGARTSFGMDTAHPIEDLDGEMIKLLSDASAFYHALGHSAALDTQVRTWLQGVRRLARSGVTAPAHAQDLFTLLDEMRLFKDDTEQALMLRAATISGHAHARAMRVAQAGMFEYEIEAELLHEFRRNGAQFPAYTSIVAAGANACVLHYSANNARTRDGELVLIDAGCELDGYASDVTRTWPVNGVFSAPQKQLYQLVLDAQAAALAQVRPGQRYNTIHEAAVRVLTEGMLEVGLLEPAVVGSVDDAIAARSFQQFYMHGTGHWLGMDVHDVGRYREADRLEPPWRMLQPGMALTVEPGIYVRPAATVPERFWNIGIRIEDDVIVDAQGCRILSAAAPKTLAEIEQLMRGR